MAVPTFSQLFGQVIRAKRVSQGITQEALAGQAGIHATYVGLIERGERNCSLDIAKALSDALNEPLSKLIAETEAVTGTKTSGTKKKAVNV